MSTSTGRRRREEQGQGTQGVADSVGEAQEGGERFLALEADLVQAEGQGKSPNTPSVPWPDHWAFKNPKGVAYCRDHHLHNKWDHAADPTTARSGRMVVGVRCPPIEACATGMPSPSQVTGGHSGCHRPRGFLVSVGTTGHQCESAGGQDGLRWERTSPAAPEGPIQGTPGRKHPFPPHPPRQWEDPPKKTRGEDPPGKGRSKA